MLPFVIGTSYNLNMVFISAPDAEGVIEEKKELPYRKAITSPNSPGKTSIIRQPEKVSQKTGALV
ncbi:MAG: hypothetical protein ACREF7_01900 [Candidatus Saccharimonadales bacterium]